MYKRLKELRIKNNITQKQIAEYLEIPKIIYSVYEKGKKEVPVYILSKLAKFYNTSIDFIVGDTDQIVPYK